MKHLEIWRRLTSLLVKKCWELSFFVLALIPGVPYIGDSYWDSLQLKLTPLLGKEEPGFGNDLEPLVLEIKRIRHISSSRGYIICPLKQGDQLQASPEAVSADNFQLMPGHHQRCYQATTKTYRVPYSHLALGVTVTCIYTSTLPLVNLLVLILSVWIWALPNLFPLWAAEWASIPRRDGQGDLQIGKCLFSSISFSLWNGSTFSADHYTV